MLMKKKEGFSLIEMIVVIAIMAIVLGFGALGISTLTGQKVKTASKDIYNMFGSSQLIAMSKGDTFFGLTYLNGQVHVGTFYKQEKTSNLYNLVEDKSIAASVEVYCLLSDGSKIYIGDPDASTPEKQYESGMFIYYDRNTGSTSGGAFKVAHDKYPGGGIGFVPANLGASQIWWVDITDKPDITHICIERSGDDIDICIVPLTGKFFYND